MPSKSCPSAACQTDRRSCCSAAASQGQLMQTSDVTLPSVTHPSQSAVLLTLILSIIPELILFCAFWFHIGNVRPLYPHLFNTATNSDLTTIPSGLFLPIVYLLWGYCLQWEFGFKVVKFLIQRKWIWRFKSFDCAWEYFRKARSDILISYWDVTLRSIKASEITRLSF